MRLSVAEFLPDIGLPSTGQTLVLFGMHSAACEGCRRYFDELAPSAAEFGAWDAGLTVTVPGTAEQFVPAFGSVVIDAEFRISSPQNAALFVADRYRQIFEACHAGSGHRFPPPRQIEEWLKFLGTLCPE